MSEIVLNNLLEKKSYDFSNQAKTKGLKEKTKNFAQTMQKIKKKNSQKNISKQIEETPLNQKEFLAKLKEILRKNNKEVPSELLSLLEGGSLNKQQQAMLESLMLNLKNNNLDISELKSLLAKNNNQETIAVDQNSETLNQTESGIEFKVEDLDPAKLEKLESLLENDKQLLSQNEISNLKSEIDQLAQILMSSDSENPNNVEKNQTDILAADNLVTKLKELSTALSESEFSSEDLANNSELKELKLPTLAKLFNSDNLETTLNPENESSIFAELSSQLQQMLKEEKNQVTKNNSALELDFNNSDLFTLKNDSTFDFSLDSKNLVSQNQNNFFDLENPNLIFNSELGNQNEANNLNLDTFNLNLENKAQLAENTDLRAQVAEQFKGSYSPETKEMQIQLKPESLGKIDISLTYDNDQLTGKMLVESELVRAQLENSLKGLKSDLLKQGINIDQFKIETAKNSPQQVEKQQDFAFNDQNSAFSDGETGQNQEYEQRQFFQGQYYVQRQHGSSDLNNENIIMKQQEMLSRAAFSTDKLNLLA